MPFSKANESQNPGWEKMDTPSIQDGPHLPPVSR